MTDPVPIDVAMADTNLLGAALGDPSPWSVWVTVFKAVYGLGLCRLLERRTARSGKDSVDHGVGGSDDHANVLAGAVNLVVKGGDVKFVGPIIVTAPRTYFGEHPEMGMA